MSGLAQRKSEHLNLCIDEDVEHRASTLLSDVHLLHEALPEISCADVDLSTRWCGRSLQAPLVISGMTGGTAEAGVINRALASAAQKHGLGFGVGSQRVMLRDSSAAASFRVRDVAPDVLLLGNLGAVQARDTSDAEIDDLIGAIGADALCIHLNPAQELVQDDGDRDFRGCLARIAELTVRLRVPVIAKETGCGLSPRTLGKLLSAGVTWVDVSGSGGTSWTGVEALRGSERQQTLGLGLREWGIPTAVSVLYARREGLRVIASGGVRSAGDAVSALALGAHGVSMALPFLRAWSKGGEREVNRSISAMLEGMSALFVLTGSRNLEELQAAPRVLGRELRAWLPEQ